MRAAQWESAICNLLSRSILSIWVRDEPWSYVEAVLDYTFFGTDRSCGARIRLLSGDVALDRDAGSGNRRFGADQALRIFGEPLRTLAKTITTVAKASTYTAFGCRYVSSRIFLSFHVCTAALFLSIQI